MLTTTRKKPLKKISEITFDLEIINPIESKNLFGGCEYHYICSHSSTYGEGINTSGGSWLDTVVVTNNSYYGNSSWYSSNHIMNGGYSSDWDKANWGNDYNNNDYDLWVDQSSDWNDSNNDGINDSEQNDPSKFQPSVNVPQQGDMSNMGACVSFAMAYIANGFGANVTPNAMAGINGQNLGLNANMISFVGMSQTQANLAVNSYFNAIQCTSYDAINSMLANGNPVLANYITSYNQANNTAIAHEVVLLSYDSVNNIYWIADSAAQNFNTSLPFIPIDANSISLNSAFGITGIKP